jgi:hypothetical protein
VIVMTRHTQLFAGVTKLGLKGSTVPTKPYI